jgi:CBS domain-containing protein
MSPRAACRLATLGFDHVYDYVAGKVDWLARNQPVHGSGAETTIGGHLRAEVVTARRVETVAAVRDRLQASGHGFALVTTEDGILLGRLRAAALNGLGAAAATTPVEEVMEAGPSTLRPHERARDVHARLVERRRSYAIVTDPDGRLLGTVHPGDLPST